MRVGFHRGGKTKREKVLNNVLYMQNFQEKYLDKFELFKSGAARKIEENEEESEAVRGEISVL